MVGAIVCKAATRYVKKSDGSLSPLSSDSQATCRSQPATHALTSVVFPKPAGAAMRVSLRYSPSFSRSSRRGRLTTFGRSRGIYSFVAKISVTFSLLQRLPRSFFPWPTASRSREYEFCAWSALETGGLYSSISDVDRISQAMNHQFPRFRSDSHLSAQNLTTLE